jgi:hypothetical protein
MRLVYKHENRGLVYSIKNILAINNIVCLVKNDFGNTMGAEFGIANTLLELWVKNDDDYEEARRIIQAQEQPPENTEEWNCASCGEINASNFARCWNCQNSDEEPS